MDTNPQNKSTVINTKSYITSITLVHFLSAGSFIVGANQIYQGNFVTGRRLIESALITEVGALAMSYLLAFSLRN
jgi:hypothetical protein